MSCRDNIDRLRKQLNLPEGEIFDYSGDAGEDKYSKCNDFFCRVLAEYEPHGIKPSYFYFIDSNTLEAWANKKNNNYLIRISREFIEYYDRRFNSVFNVGDLGDDYFSLAQKLKDPIGEMMFEVASAFTFYHELGHLIQFASGNGVECKEAINGEEKYSIENHADELDADLFSSLCCCEHIYQYFEKYFPDPATEEELKKYISLFSSVIFIFFLSLEKPSHGYYLKQKSHPHPILRIISVVNRIIDYFDFIRESNGLVQISINPNEVIKETFLVSEKLVPNLLGETRYENFYSLFIENKKEIFEYYDELKTLIMNNPDSAINKRNKMIPH